MTDEQKEICDICGRKMFIEREDGTKVSWIGNKFEIKVSILDPTMNALCKQEFNSIYPEIDADKAYMACYACWLKSMGFKLDRED